MTGSVRPYVTGSWVDTVTAFTAANMNDPGGSLLGYLPINANVGPTSTSMNGGVINSAPVNASRIIKVTFCGTLRATGPTGLQVIIFEDSLVLDRFNFSVYSSGVDAGFCFSTLSLSPSAGNHNYTGAFGVTGLSGQSTSLVAGTSPDDHKAWILVEDVAPFFA